MEKLTCICKSFRPVVALILMLNLPFKAGSCSLDNKGSTTTIKCYKEGSDSFGFLQNTLFFVNMIMDIMNMANGQTSKSALNKDRFAEKKEGKLRKKC